MKTRGSWKKKNKMRLITFDSQLHEAKFKLFLEKHIDKMWSKTQDPEKLQDVLNSAYAKRQRKSYKGFGVNTLNLRNTFSKDC